jgi:hypothetical protein
MYRRPLPQYRRPPQIRQTISNRYILLRIFYVLLALGVLGALGWLAGITAVYSDNNGDINTLKKDLSALTVIVNEQEEFINNLITDPAAIFETICYEDVDITINDTFRTLSDPGLGALCPMTSDNYELVYDDATGCFNGTGLEVNDTFFINVRVTGDTTPLFIGTMQSIYCNGTEIPYQGVRGDLQLTTNDTVTLTEQFFFTVTEDILNGDGVIIRLKTSDPTYHMNISSIYYVVLRYRPFSGPLLVF